MTELMDLLLFLARAVLVAFCARHAVLLLATPRTYSQFSSGLGGLIYIVGIVVAYLPVTHIIPGRDLSRTVCAVGLALALLPLVLQWAAPTLYRRITKEC